MGDKTGSGIGVTVVCDAPGNDARENVVGTGVRVVKLLGVGSGAASVCWRGLAVPLLPKSRGHCGALPASGGELPVIKNRPWVLGLDGSSCLHTLQFAPLVASDQAILNGRPGRSL